MINPDSMPEEQPEEEEEDQDGEPQQQEQKRPSTHASDEMKTSRAEMMEAERQRKAQAAERAAKRKAKAEERRIKAAQEKAGEMERREAQNRESERRREETERQKAESKERLVHDLFLATREGKVEQLRTLMESQQTSIDQKDVSWIRDGRGATLLHACVTAWPSAAETSPNVKEGRLAAASYLLGLDVQRGYTMVDMIKDQDDQGRSLVHA